MDRQTFESGMARIVVFYKPPQTTEEKAHFKGYMDTIYENCSKMDPFLFDTVTRELSKSLSRGQKPVPSQFYAVYERLREKLPKKEFVCDSCTTTGWVTVWMLETETGATERFVKPCPSCRPNHAYKNAPNRSGWVEMEGEPESKPTKATQDFLHDFFGIQAKTPQEALDEITKRYREGKVKVSDLVTVLKRQQTRQPSPLPNRIKRINELTEGVIGDALKNMELAREKTEAPATAPVEGSPAPVIAYEVDE